MQDLINAHPSVHKSLTWLPVPHQFASSSFNDVDRVKCELEKWWK